MKSTVKDLEDGDKELTLEYSLKDDPTQIVKTSFIFRELVNNNVFSYDMTVKEEFIHNLSKIINEIM